MGTHPIFESDFDCLTETRNNDGRFDELKVLSGILTATIYGSLVLISFFFIEPKVQINFPDPLSLFRPQ